MRRGSKRIAISSAKNKTMSPLTKPTRDNDNKVARIRERRERIYQREGTLSDSSILIREERDRSR